MNTTHINEIIKYGGRVFEVGGTVRDRLIAEKTGEVIEPKDRDFVVTGLPLHDLVAVLDNHGRVNLVGKSFGVLKFRPAGKTEEIDIALPRTEVSTGSGHRDFEVDFDHNLSIEDDLGRRDFTLNAIAVDLETDEVIDPFDGRGAIDSREIRLVFPGAFEDDPLRMLRAVQFAARFKFYIDRKTMDAILKNTHLIDTISGERVFAEIVKVMQKAEFPSIAFKRMRETGILKHIFPELDRCVGVSQPAKHHNLDVFNHILHAVDSVPSTKLHVRLAALFHDIAKPETKTDKGGVIHFIGHEWKAEKHIRQVLGDRWKSPNDLVDKVVRLVKNHMFAAEFDMTPRAIRRLISRVGEDLIFDLIDLRFGDRIASGKAFLSMGKIGRMREIVAAELAEPAFSIANLAVSGHDLIDLGITPGPRFKEILTDLLEIVMDDPSANDKSRLIEIVKDKEGIM